MSTHVPYPISRAWPRALSRGESTPSSPWAWVWPVLLIGHFFLPYVPGTRYRVEVFTLFLGLLFPLFPTKVTTSREIDLVVFTGISAFWSLLRVLLLPHPQGLAPTAIHWINLNFPFLATCFYLLLRNTLQRHRRTIIKTILTVGVVNNLVAVAQCYYPDWPYHSWIYAHYGGTISADYDDVLAQVTVTAMSNAEFLAKLGGRYTGILVSSHMLSVFNVWLIGTSYAFARDPRSTPREQLFAAGSLGLSVLGGMLSGGKMFYLGVLVMFAALFLVRRQLTLMIWGGMMGLTIFAVATRFLDESAEVRQALDRVLSGNVESILGTRFASDGYLRDTLERFATDYALLAYGTGAKLDNLVVADSLFLLPLATGGIPQLCLYLWPIVWLLRELWRRSSEPGEYLAVLFSLHFSFLVSGIGVPVYQMGRIAPLLWMTTLAFAFAPREVPKKTQEVGRANTTWGARPAIPALVRP